jgi:hypothetical protein
MNICLKMSLASAVMLVAASAMAQSASTAATQNQSVGSTSSANGGALLFAPVSESTNTVKYPASSSIAPPLATGVCMGSSTGGVEALKFGFSLGTTWKDDGCDLRENAQALRNSGQQMAAVALLCTDNKMRYAISVSGGYPVKQRDGSVLRVGCPMSQKDWEAKGEPMVDPMTGQTVTSGMVIQAAPVMAATPKVSDKVMDIELHAAALIEKNAKD